MEKNNSNQFYDPYNFSGASPYMQGAANPLFEGNEQMAIPPAISPASQYEQQYMYYRYLTQMMDYKIKSKEYDRLSKELDKS
ncbi:MAG: hypothetical protein RR922_03550 [Clostridia bacterium]